MLAIRLVKTLHVELKLHKRKTKKSYEDIQAEGL